jgi:hypothetical protein
MSVVLGDGGHYAMPNTTYRGSCWTFEDQGGSSVFPPCRTDGSCFTPATGLCVSASLPPGSATAWGVGFGCSLNQAAEPGAAPLSTSVAGMTRLTIGVYGCAVPAELQVQLNVVNSPSDDAGIPGSGYFCRRATLGPADANGVRTATVQLTELVQDCWVPGGLVFEPATMNAKSVQVQINAPEGQASSWDLCVSKLSLE